MCALRDELQLPGMRVLQFAFDGDPNNPFLPENYDHNTVAYSGTQDNDTTRGWYTSLPPSARQVVNHVLHRADIDADHIAWELIRLAWASRAAVTIVPLQDVLNLGTEARMNIPGQAQGNWDWRCPPGVMTASTFCRLRELTERGERSPKFNPVDSVGQ